MKSFITGIDGFIGNWLVHELGTYGDQISGLTRSSSNINTTVTKYRVDLNNATEIANIIKKVKPDRLFHLAAQSNISQSFKDPSATIDTNVKGSLNLLEAIRKYSPKTIFISIGSSSEYGLTAQKQELLSEDMPLLPSSPYGISKAAQGFFSMLYFRTHKLKAIHVRPFAIIGPGKIGDALYDFCQGIIQIEAGESRQLLTGNLEIIRDFMDVRDMVALLVLLSAQAKWGEIYNMCSGEGYKLSEIVNILKSLSPDSIQQLTDGSKARTTDDERIVGSCLKINEFHFKRQFTLEDTVEDTLNYWRAQQNHDEV